MWIWCWTYYTGSFTGAKHILFWICQNVLHESGDLDHYVTIGHLLTGETNKRCTVDTHLEWDQSILALRRIMLCKRELSREQKDKLKAELFLRWVGLHIQTEKVQHFYCLANVNHWEKKSVSQTCCFQLQVASKEVVGGKYFLCCCIVFGLFSYIVSY